MNVTQDFSQLRSLADLALPAPWEANNTEVPYSCKLDFRKAATPEVVIALLDALEGLQAEVADMQDTIDSNNKLCISRIAELTRERNAALARERHTRETLNKFMEAGASPQPVQPSQVVEAWNPSTNQMTADRATYFMRRFKHEEKLLGPNEQAAIDYVIALLVQPSPAREFSDADIRRLCAGWFDVDGKTIHMRSNITEQVMGVVRAAINAKEPK